MSIWSHDHLPIWILSLRTKVWQCWFGILHIERVFKNLSLLHRVLFSPIFSFLFPGCSSWQTGKLNWITMDSDVGEILCLALSFELSFCQMFWLNPDFCQTVWLSISFFRNLLSNHSFNQILWLAVSCADKTLKAGSFASLGFAQCQSWSVHNGEIGAWERREDS